MSSYDPRNLDDARTLRALAHPLRIELMDQLTFRGPLTATQCAEHAPNRSASVGKWR